ncbi:MAG: hypothetical protein ABW321_30240 [Polyangiales bacterium]
MTKARLLMLGVGWCLLSATTPGAVGSCGGGDDLSKPADFEQYCVTREELICTRRYLREEITGEARDICRWDAVDACDRRAFPSDCRPSRRETEACLRALSSFDTLETPESSIDECRTDALCTATPSEQAPDANGGDDSEGT